MRTKLVMSVILGVMLIGLLVGPGWADISGNLTIQGKLTPPVPSNTMINFALYDVATGGTRLNNASGTSLFDGPNYDSTTGVFNAAVDISSGSIILPFDKQYWVGIKVGNDPEMTPRQPLRSAPYAVTAKNVYGGSGYLVGSLEVQGLAVINKGTQNTLISGGQKITSGSNNTAVGFYSLMTATAATNNTAVGSGALMSSTASNNTALGSYALGNNTTGVNNCALGSNALLTNTGGRDNVAIGTGALASNVSGSRNVAIGQQSSYNILGSGNVFIGPMSGPGSNVSYKFGLSSTDGSIVYPLISGDFVTKLVSFEGIVEAYGLKIKNGTAPLTGKVLTSDSNGNATWQTAPGSSGNTLPSGSSGQTLRNNGTSWVAAGNLYNNGTNIGIGTTAPLSKFDVSGGLAVGSYAGANAAPTNGLIVSGNAGIGTTSPGAPLDVRGDIRISTASGNSSSRDIGKLSFSTGSRADTAYIKGAINNTFDDNSTLSFYTTTGGNSSATQRMLIDNAGNVGIGTSTTVCRLTVMGVGSTATQGFSSSAISGMNTSYYSGHPVNAVGVYGEVDGGTGTSGVSGKANQGVGVKGISGGGYGVYGSGYVADFYSPNNTYAHGSSIRWKENVLPIKNALAKVVALKGVYFDWNRDHGGMHDVGMIAEEVAKVVPEAVTMDKDAPGYANSISDGKLVPFFIEAIKELKAENDALKARLEALEKK